MGALLLGIVVPCAGFEYCVRYLNDPGGPLLWPIVMVIGLVGGAVLGPLVAVPLYWLIWRWCGRP